MSLTDVLEAAKEVARQEERRKLFAYQPYGFQQQLHAASADKNQILLMAANRVGKCVTADTLIDTPSGKVRMGDLKRGDEVYSLTASGEVVVAEISEIVTKAPERCYRVWLANGESFECSSAHRVLLSNSKWGFVGDLLRSVPRLDRSSSEPSREGFLAGVRYWIRRARDFLVGYQAYCRSGGVRLHRVEGSALASAPSPAGVPRHIAPWWHSGGQGGKGIDTPLRSWSRPSIRGASIRVLARCVVFGCRIADTIDALSHAKFRESPQPAIAAASHLQSGVVSDRGQGTAPSCRGSIGLSNLIVGYSDIGVQTLYDASVMQYGNYVAAGVVHHNTHSGAMEMAFHLTGLYPDWWQGRRFHRPIKAWAAGTTNDKTRDILQSALLGDPKNPAAFGTGAIPGEWITSTTRKPGIPNALSAVAVRHVAGTSVLAFKSYEMGPPAFMGESLDIVWLDEEPPYQIYSQVLARILDRKGFLYMTFTPENGATELVTDLVNSPKRGQAVINATWDDAPHLDAEAKKQILDALPAHERDMRSKGIPMLGSGVVFPVPEEQIKCAAFDCPDYFRFISAIDFGWDHPTAAVLGALDPETGTFYVTRTYRESNKKIPDHAKALREVVGSTRMVWPHDGAKHDSGSGDGLADQYRAAGLKMLPSHFTNPPGPGQKEGQGGNAVEPGIQAMLTAMETGKFKVFDTPENQAWFQEFRMYHRKDGMIVKHNDDLMSATRYAFMSKRWAKDRQPFRPSGMAILEDNPLSAYL